MHDNAPRGSDESVRKAKQEKFQAAASKPVSPLTRAAAIGLGGILLLAVAYFVFIQPDAGSITGGGPDVASPPDQDVRISLDELKDGRAKFLRYQASNGKEVQFFTIKSSDGVYRAALNACDTCFAAKLGYSQDGSDLICNKCGMKFPSHLISVTKGGCNPVPLEPKVQGDQLVIRASELQRGESYF